MLLSELPFGAFLSYTPRPQTPERTESKNWMYALKTDSIAPSSNPPELAIVHLVNKLKEWIPKSPLKGFFSPLATLVPMPSSSLRLPGGQWVPKKIAGTMFRAGLGTSADILLERTEPIPKSAFSSAPERPRPQTHYRTLGLCPTLIDPERILIIDDIVTRGASMIGAASVLAEAYPDVPIAGFALIRTISNNDDFRTLVDPCVGTITCKANSTHREP